MPNELSAEYIAQLSKVLSQAESLMARQEEIITKVLDGEKQIGERRIAYLEQYFTKYYAGLDDVSRKTSKLGDGFLILERQMTSAFKGGGGNSGERRLPPAKDDGSGGAGGSGSSGGGSGGGRSRRRSKENSDDDGAVDVAQKTSSAAKKKMRELTDTLGKDFADEVARFYQKTAEERHMAIEDAENEAIKNGRAPLIQQSEVEQARAEQHLRSLKRQSDQKKSILNSMLELEIAMYRTEEDMQDQMSEHRLSRIQAVTKAELDAQNLINSIDTQLAYGAQHPEEAGELRAREDDAAQKLKEAQALNEAIEKDRAKREAYYRRKNNGILSKEDAARVAKELENKYKSEKKNAENLAKQRGRLATIESEKQNAKERDELRAGISAVGAKGASLAERKQALYELTHDENGNADVGKAMSAAVLAVADLAKQLEGKIDEIAGKKGDIDTRLQGSKNKKFMGSYWDQLVRDMTSVGAVNPFFKQETFSANIETLVKQGISFDLKQRAFLMTVSDKIASTFEVSNATLLRLVRIQQEDSTAGRLGMESALNAFLNEMYETSEYLGTVADGVRTSLEEMEALMKGAEATEVEWQVQKWLGSLYSVGMSQGAVSSISDALGQIAAGQIEGLTNGGAGNLLIMAANDAGLSIADILTNGINSKDTNKLLQAAVNYLAELSDSAKDNKVVQQQLANVFGVKASDLRAATNLVVPGSTNSIFGNSMTYSNMLNQLSKMAGSMYARTSVAEMMTNFWENGQYTLAGSMASNPVSYFIYKMAKVVDDAAGGIDLPFLNVMGFGVDLNTTVSDLMRVAAVSGGILGSIGPMISGLGSSFSGRAMLDKLGIGSGSGLSVVQRGGGTTAADGGSQGGGSQSTSQSGYAGNSSGSDVKDSTIQESEDSKKQQMIEAKEEEEANQVDVLNTTVIKIYELLEEVASGKSTFKVKVEGYGLTKAGGSGAGSGALGGVSALNSRNGGNSNSSTGVNSSSVSGNVDLGGWIMV